MAIEAAGLFLLNIYRPVSTKCAFAHIILMQVSKSL